MMQPLIYLQLLSLRTYHINDAMLEGTKLHLKAKEEPSSGQKLIFLIENGSEVKQF